MMKKVSLIAGVLFLIFSLQSCFIDDLKPIRGNGNVVSRDFQMPSFSKIDVGSTFTVYLSQGDTEEVSISADENLFPFIEVEMINNRLRIRTTRNITHADELSVHITMVELEDIEISGAAEIFSTEHLEFQNIKMEISGASEGEMVFTADEFTLELSGSSDLFLDFSAEEVYIEESGASDLNMIGNANYLRMDLSGSSEFDALNFETIECNLDCSGASNADVYVLEYLRVVASGASHIRYKGNPEIEIIELSGSSTLEPY